MAVDDITFNVNFTYRNLDFTASYVVTLPTHKRPMLDHVSRSNGLLLVATQSVYNENIFYTNISK
jgi:hypothetical protein